MADVAVVNRTPAHMQPDEKPCSPGSRLRTGAADTDALIVRYRANDPTAIGAVPAPRLVITIGATQNAAGRATEHD